MAIIGPRLPWHPTTAGVTIPGPGDHNHLRSGVTLGLFPSGFGYDVELWRSTQSSTGAGSSSKWSLDATMTRGMNAEIVYQDILLQSTQKYYYRGRQNFPGCSPSRWTTVVGAKPVVIGTELSVNTPGFGSTALRWLGVPVGSSTGLAKTLTYPYSDFLAKNSTTPWGFSSGWLSPDASTIIRNYFAAVKLPKGIVITGIAMRGFLHQTISANLIMTLLQASSVGGLTTIVGVQQNATGWVTTPSTAISHTGTTFGYLLRVIAKRPSSTAALRVLWGQVQYTMATFNQTV